MELISILQGKASRADKSPATGVTVVLSATANNGKLVLLDKEEIVTDRKTGTFSWTLDLPRNIKCLTFTVWDPNRENFFAVYLVYFVSLPPTALSL